MKKSLIVILLMLVTRSTIAGDDFCGIVLYKLYKDV